MSPAPNPLLRAAGSHAEVGRQIGEATADAIRRAVAEVRFGRGNPCDSEAQTYRFTCPSR